MKCSFMRCFDRSEQDEQFETGRPDGDAPLERSTGFHQVRKLEYGPDNPRSVQKQ